MDKIGFPLYVASDDGIIYRVESVQTLASHFESLDFISGGIAVYDSFYRRVQVEEALRFISGNFILSLDKSLTPEQSAQQLWQRCVDICVGMLDYMETEIADNKLPALIEILRKGGLVKGLEERTTAFPRTER